MFTKFFIWPNIATPTTLQTSLIASKSSGRAMGLVWPTAHYIIVTAHVRILGPNFMFRFFF